MFMNLNGGNQLRLNNITFTFTPVQHWSEEGFLIKIRAYGVVGIYKDLTILFSCW